MLGSGNAVRGNYRSGRLMGCLCLTGMEEAGSHVGLAEVLKHRQKVYDICRHCKVCRVPTSDLVLKNGRACLAMQSLITS